MRSNCSTGFISASVSRRSQGACLCWQYNPEISGISEKPRLAEVANREEKVPSQGLTLMSEK